MMSELRNPDNIFDTDFVGKSFINMKWKHATIKDYYKKIKGISLAEYCPENVKQHFNDARNLYMYSYYHYRFCTIARRELITALEAALKLRVNDVKVKGKILGLKDLTDIVVENNLINQDNLKEIRPNLKSINDFQDLMTDYRSLRNELSHGTDVIYPTIMQEFVDIRNIINLLFKH